MKIDKLLTLSQFIDEIHSDGTGLVDELARNFLDVRRYQHFLKQPLTKDMFVNRFKKPRRDDYVVDGVFSSINIERCSLDTLEWCNAEKKIVFSGDWDIETDSRYYHLQWAKDKSDVNETVQINKYRNINQLAEATNGKLTLKNVTI